MGQALLDPLVHYLRHAAGPAPGASDSELLEAFLLQRDEPAFAAIVRRYGPLVLGICRRVLRHEQDAEDAFQATFLVLARRARAIRKRASLGSWLHGVALRVARKAHTRAARRPDCLEDVPERPAPETSPEWLWREVRQVLDEEIGRLPEHYRRPFVLCYLEGRTNEDAARRLGCPKGTVLSRLARARKRLAERLTRRGVTPGAPALATLLSAEGLRAAVPPALAGATARACVLAGAGAAGGVSARVLELASEGGKVVGAIKAKGALAVLLAVGAFGAGAGALARREAPAGEDTNAVAVVAPAEKAAPRPKPSEPKKEAKEEKESDPRLEEVLCRWAKSADAVKSMRYRFTMTQRDKTFESKEVTRGEVWFRKPDLLRIDFADKKYPRIVFFTDKAIHEFNSRERIEKVFPKPADGSFMGAKTPERGLLRWLSGALIGEAYQQQLYWLFAGLPVRDLPKTFRLRLAKEDRYYVYLDLRPRREEDRASFRRMRVVLSRDGYWVRQLWVEQANRNDMTLDFERPDTDPRPPITPESIRKGLPKGWKRVNVPGHLPGEEAGPKKPSPGK